VVKLAYLWRFASLHNHLGVWGRR